MKPNVMGESIREARRRLDMTQVELAQRLGVSQPAVNSWERGRTAPKAAMLSKIQAILKLELKILDRPRFPVSFGSIEMRFAGDVPTSEAWGDPLASEEPIEMDAKFDSPKRFVARVVGDSCFPALQQGDLTVWHQDFAPTYGQIVLAQRKGDHGCTVKQLLWDGERAMLKPVNPKSSVPPDGEGWGIIARLVGVVFRVNGAELSIYKPEGIGPSDLDWR